MADHDPRTYKLIALVGTSPISYADATKHAVERAGETLRGLGWCEVTAQRGLLEHGTLSAYQVTLKVGFRVLDRDQGYDALHPAHCPPGSPPMAGGGPPLLWGRGAPVGDSRA